MQKGWKVFSHLNGKSRKKYRNTPQRNLTNSKEKSKILITMQKHAYYRFFQKEIIIKIRRSEDGPK